MSKSELTITTNHGNMRDKRTYFVESFNDVVNALQMMPYKIKDRDKARDLATKICTEGTVEHGWSDFHLKGIAA